MGFRNNGLVIDQGLEGLVVFTFETSFQFAVSPVCFGLHYVDQYPVPPGSLELSYRILSIPQLGLGQRTKIWGLPNEVLWV